jgi:hypothetical protein
MLSRYDDSDSDSDYEAPPATATTLSTPDIDGLSFPSPLKEERPAYSDDSDSDNEQPILPPSGTWEQFDVDGFDGYSSFIRSEPGLVVHWQVLKGEGREHVTNNECLSFRIQMRNLTVNEVTGVVTEEDEVFDIEKGDAFSDDEMVRLLRTMYSNGACEQPNKRVLLYLRDGDIPITQSTSTTDIRAFRRLSALEDRRHYEGPTSTTMPATK